MKRELIQKAAKVLRITLYLAIAATVFLVIWSLIDWFVSEPGYEVQYTVAAAILSLLLWLLTFLAERVETQPSARAIELFPSSCGDEPIDLTDRRLYISSAFGTYFASLLEREQGYISLPGQIDLPWTGESNGLDGLQALYWALSKPRGPRVLVIAAEGGMGKSTLAARLVRCLFQQDSVDLLLGDSAKTQHIDPVTGEMVQLEPGYYDAESFLRRLASQLNLRYPNAEPFDTRSVLRAVLTRVAGRRAILVIDNLESVSTKTQVLDSAQQLASRDLRVIVTTRAVDRELLQKSKALVAYLKPIDSLDVARKFVKWHIAKFSHVHPGLRNVEPHLQNTELVKRLLRKTGGIPLLVQLVVSDVARSDWSCVESLPDLYSSELLDFLYAQRWSDLCGLGERGECAILLLRFVAARQEKGRRVTRRRLDEWSQTVGMQDLLQEALRLLNERFLLVNQDLRRGNYVVFPSLVNFLTEHKTC